MSSTLVTPSASSRRRGDAITAAALVGIIVMLMAPVPARLLDVMLVLNLAMALTTVLVVSSVRRPLDLSVFPAALLVMTLARLSLNVASTRLILMQGEAFEGVLIRSFGQIMVGGSLAIGFVVFLILVVIQILVISRGAERVAEVAARFRLDAMPLKIMAVQSLLDNDQISSAEAEEKMDQIQREADFYGSMDGASRFVKGETLAGILIFSVNIGAGVYMGLQSGTENLLPVISGYALLTVGDGLVSMIPSLLISMATGLLITKSSSDSSVADDAMAQFGTQHRALGSASAILAILLTLFGVGSDLPSSPFLLAAVVLGLYSRRAFEAGSADEEEAASTLATGSSSFRVLELRLSLPLFGRLLEQGRSLESELARLRSRVERELGMHVPPITVTVVSSLSATGMALDLRGQLVAESNVFAPESEDEDQPEPEIVRFVERRVRQSAEELLGRQELEDLLDEVRRTSPAVYEAVSEVDRGSVLAVFRGLLSEGVGIRDRTAILEAIAASKEYHGQPVLLTEAVRSAIARHVSGAVRTAGARLPVMTFSPELETELAEALVDKEDYVALSPGRLQALLRLVTQGCDDFEAAGLPPVLLTTPALRRHVKALVGPFLQQLTVLSRREISRELMPEFVKQLHEESSRENEAA